MLKSNKGITLIALIVTIIVLLILAGVSISMIAGKNGIATRAQDAKIKQSEAEIKESIEMAVSVASLEGLGKIDKSTLEETLTKKFGATGYTLTEENDNYIIKVKEIEYKVSDLGKIEDLKIIEFELEYEIGSTETFSCEEGMTWDEFFGSDYFQSLDTPIPAFSSLYVQTEEEPQYLKTSDGINYYLCDSDDSNKYVHSDYTISEGHSYVLVQE